MDREQELLGIYRKMWMMCPDPVPESWERLITAITAELRLRGIDNADMVAAAREGIAESQEVCQRCHGSGEYVTYEDGAPDTVPFAYFPMEEVWHYCDCPAGRRLQAEHEAAADHDTERIPF